MKHKPQECMNVANNTVRQNVYAIPTKGRVMQSRVNAHDC